ncbi:MAG: succinate dehydrogenase, hydrophobic membrane anchor protein [Gammaproteobacteria bacterium]|nr:succinate dehydrogenase, hydrophobic membrane anchor protein [Gammaproteobacteria bacterium]
MDLRTPLGRVRGLGSAKTGLHHWWAQRLTAVALVPLTLWFVGVTIAMVNGDYDSARAWVSGPFVAAIWVLFLVALFHHAQLGMQVIIEDYVHDEAFKLTALILMKLIFAIVGLVAVIAVLRIALGS